MEYIENSHQTANGNPKATKTSDKEAEASSNQPMGTATVQGRCLLV